MDFTKFTGRRWTIIYGKYEGLEEYAVNELYKAVQQFVPYVLTVGDGSDGQMQDLTRFNIIFVGTVISNHHMAKLAKEGLFRPEQRKEGYAIKVCASPYDPEMQIMILAGADDSGTLYAVRDLEHYYIDPKSYFDGSRHPGERTYFTEKMPEYEINSAPAIEYRGMWTWGHAIHDHRKYFDNMSRWKLNYIVIWNDFAPVNAVQIVKYAHSRGIKVLWGYSWSWGEDVDPTDDEELEKWTRRAMDIYETQYRDIGGDGIYFQSFTETRETMIKGASIAEMAVKWTNTIAGGILDKYPGLWIMFGISATSILDDPALKNVDIRVTNEWNDAGPFPYAYDARDTADIQYVYDYTEMVSGYRGTDEDFSMVVKGCITLDWPSFEHQKGPFVLGEAAQSFKENRVEEKRSYWKYIQTYWIRNYECMLRTMRIIAGKDIKRRSASTLIEDGMWEEHMWLPGALSAEGMWDPYRGADEIIEKVMLTKDIYFA
jgi:hypothetical protein